MKNQDSYQYTIIALMIIPLMLMGWKFGNGYFTAERLLPSEKFQVSMNYESSSAGKDEIFIKSFLPQNTFRQTISNEVSSAKGFNFSLEENEKGLKGKWKKKNPKKKNKIQYKFQFEGKDVDYQLDKKIRIEENDIQENQLKYLLPSEHIQSNHDRIIQVTDWVTKDSKTIHDAIQKIYHHVFIIKSIKTSELTDALTTLEKREASCNGKSRLFVAMCRAKGIPARVAGGIILKPGKKRTSHLWSEILVNNTWIPFDCLNGHFARIPNYYMEMYKGDHFLMSHTVGVDFDYMFDIEKEEVFATSAQSSLTLWSLPLKANIPMSLLKVILLLPLCALVIALFRNVIGIKTFGVFLPAIITVSLDSLGVGFGVLAYVIVVAVVGLLHFPLNKWGLLYTPKLVVMLVGVITTLLITTSIGIALGSVALSSLILFPIIILTIAAEKFAKTIMEEGIEGALKIQGQTLFVILFCYAIYNADFLVGFFLTFPESLAFIVVAMMLLGRWIGLRMSEYKRFDWIVS